MHIIVNGEPREIVPGTTLEQLVQSLAPRTDRIAAEHNLEVVPRAKYAQTLLKDGDRLEIVTFVGGG